MSDSKRTDFATLGEFGFIDRIATKFGTSASTVRGIGDDCAVIDAGEKYILVSTDMLMEGIDFDLIYTPLTHLGYKTVVAGISDILAMNGVPRQVMVSVALSARFAVEDMDAFYEGVKIACDLYNVDLAGGDTNSSITGFAINITSVGDVAKDKIVYRSGAKENDLICISGNLGAAYMGLQLLEREKRVFAGNDNVQPQFAGYEYILQRQLRPEARVDTIRTLAENNIVPTSMIDISDGLGSEILHICKSSGVGARIYLSRIPIADQTFRMAEELHTDPVIAALNGGDDYELLFTVPIERHAEILKTPGVDVIGHICNATKGAALTTPDDNEIEITAQGWV